MKIEKLHKDMKLAMINGDKTRKQVLATFIDNAKKAAIEARDKDNVTEEMVRAAILKEKKTVQEQIDTCPESRPEKLAEYQAIFKIVNEYAPQMIEDKEQIKQLIMDTVNGEYEFTAANRGAITKMVMPAMKALGNVDMKTVNIVLKEMF